MFCKLTNAKSEIMINESCLFVLIIWCNSSIYVVYWAGVNVTGDSDLQSLLSNMNQQQLMQLLGNTRFS